MTDEKVLRFPTDERRKKADALLADAIALLAQAHREYKEIGDDQGAQRCIAALNGLEPADL